MEALRLIPQAFFEFFARLVPGAVALVIWMALFGGARCWQNILEAFAAGHLDESNVSGIAIFVATGMAYVLGQLIAPLGKAAQRASELAASIFASKRIQVRNSEPLAAAGEDYDWLRANRPALGELVAKIRSEHTMFYSLAAIFAVAAVASITNRSIDWGVTMIMVVAMIACAVRGYSTRVTMRQTARKLRNGIDPALSISEN